MTSPTATEFLALFREQFSPEVQATISERSEFRQLEEWSSLQTLIIVTAIDEKYQVILSEQDFRQSKTVADLFRLLISKLNTDGSI